MSSHKRQQEEMEAPSIARPHAENDKIEIASIVTKRLSSHDVEDVTEAMTSLFNLLHPNNNNADENRKTAVRHGALLAIAQAMYRHENAATIHCNGLATLTNISCCQIDNFRPDIIEGGCLKCTIWSMGRYLGTPNVQKNGSALIGNLFLIPALRKSIVDQGGLKAVVNAMKDCKQSESVQHYGCQAVYNLLLADETSPWADETSTWAAKVATDYGCIELVISAIATHPNHAKIQIKGFEFLTQLSKAHNDYCNRVLNADGLVPVVQALRIHKDNAQVKLAARKAFDAISP